jgi:hypothetical protein
MDNYFAGIRVKAFDNRLYKNDIDTPLTQTMQLGTVVCWYGCVSEYMAREYCKENARYESLIDIQFDRTPDVISHGHFTNWLEIIKE